MLNADLLQLQPKTLFRELAKFVDTKCEDRVWSGRARSVRIYVFDGRGLSPRDVIPSSLRGVMQKSQEFLILPYTTKPVFDVATGMSALRHLALGELGLSSVLIVLVDDAKCMQWLRSIAAKAREPRAFYFVPLTNGQVFEMTKEAARGHFN